MLTNSMQAHIFPLAYMTERQFLMQEFVLEISFNFSLTIRPFRMYPIAFDVRK